MSERKVVINGLYHHFKSPLNEYYKVLNVAMHTETEEELVIYQQMFGEGKVFARPKDMFLSEVDRDKYPEAKQLYRLELIGKDNDHSKKIENLNNIFNSVYSYSGNAYYPIIEYMSEFNNEYIMTDGTIIPNFIDGDKCITIKDQSYAIIVKNDNKSSSKSRYSKLYYRENELDKIYDTIIKHVIYLNNTMLNE